MSNRPQPLIKVDRDFEEEYPGASALATECYANIVRTGDILIGMHNQAAADEYGLSGTGKQVLAVIEGAGEPLEPGVIAERLIITSGSTTSLLDTLEKRGLVRRLPHPTDRRKLLVDITPEAGRILDEMLPAFHQRERRIMSALTKAEQKQLLELLARVQAAAAADAAHEPERAVRKKPERLRRP